MSVFTNQYNSGDHASYGSNYYGDSPGSGDSNSTEKDFLSVLGKSVKAGSTFTNPVVTTFSLVYTGQNAYTGGVIDINGDIHFVPFSAPVGQKISKFGIVSTYSLVYSAPSHQGGILTRAGEIHFLPGLNSSYGQKISPVGVVSTYTLKYTMVGGFQYGVRDQYLAGNFINFVPYNSSIGQRYYVDTAYTFNLIYTTLGAYAGGVLDLNGNIHYIPNCAEVGQKLAPPPGGSPSTYSLIYTGQNAYIGGVLGLDGSIHFVPYKAPVGQKISPSGIVSTYSLLYTNNTDGGNGCGGLLAPNGDIYFLRDTGNSLVIHRINVNGIVSTFNILEGNGLSTFGGVIDVDGNIVLIPYNGTIGFKIITFCAKPFSKGILASPYLNKF